MWRMCSRRETSRLMPASRRPTAGSRSRRKTATGSPEEIHGNAEEAEFLFVPDEDVLRTATLHGKVHIEQSGDQPIARRCRARGSRLRAATTSCRTFRALDGAHLKQTGSAMQTQANSSAQDFELTAPVIDFSVVQGHILRHANTSGAAQIIIAQQNASASTSSSQQTVVTAGRFDADFSMEDGRNHLHRVHGAPNAQIVNSSPDQPERVSTSDAVDATFLSHGLDVLTQTGHVHLHGDHKRPRKCKPGPIRPAILPLTRCSSSTKVPASSRGGWRRLPIDANQSADRRSPGRRRRQKYL